MPLRSYIYRYKNLLNFYVLRYFSGGITPYGYTQVPHMIRAILLECRMAEQASWKREWRTVLLTILVYAGFFYAATEVYMISALLAFSLMVLCMTLHFLIYDEALHGHPNRNPLINALLVFPSLSLLVPY